MPPKKVLIIDDEAMARERIQRFLNELDSTIETRHAQNGLEAVKEISGYQPDVVFLDIQMPGMDGFEVLRQFESRDFQVIFQTAFDEFAVKAFEESACDYLLKPFTKERLEKAYSKALQAQGQASLLKNLNTRLHEGSRYLEKISYKQGGQIRLLTVKDIAYFLSQDHCTSAYDQQGHEHVVDFSIGYLEEQLNPEHFIRCHRSNIVRLELIKSIGSATELSLQLTSGVTLSLARSKRNSVLTRLGLAK